MNKFTMLLIFLFQCVHCVVAKSEKPNKPNIIFILVDDLGWADLACYGNTTYETPNIDRLAASGMRFTNAYASAPICSASRASLLTGKSPAALSFEFVTKPDGSEIPDGTLLTQPDYPRDLSLSEKTIAEVINPTYKCGYFGKWHLTQENDSYLSWGNKFGPLQQGFETGTENRGSHSYGYSQHEKKSFGAYKNGEFPVDSLTDEAVQFLKENQDHPFLLYYSMYYVHVPVKTRCKWLYDKYSARLGDSSSEENINYGAFIETMDHHIGTLLNALKELNLDKETIVIFTSDNGGDPRFSKGSPLKGSKWTLYEGGIRVPTIVRWPDVVRAGSISNTPIIGSDWYPTIAEIAGYKQTPNEETDGESLIPLILEDKVKAKSDRTLYWHFPFYHKPVVDTKPQSALRIGDYKAIYYYEKDYLALYNLKDDLEEKHDVAKAEPEKARDMKAILLSKLNSVKARMPINK